MFSRILLIIPLLMGLFCHGIIGAENPESLTMTILYDNHSYKEGLISGNGFSCLITGLEKTILFDTGGDAEALLYNMTNLGISPADIDIIFISHLHGDHTGGISAVLERNKEVTVYFPTGTPIDLLQKVLAYTPNLVTVNAPTAICSNVYSTGAMLKNGITEQSLIISSKGGLVLITGCAHPGIENLIKATTTSFKKPVVFVFGGFHLMGASKDTNSRDH